MKNPWMSLWLSAANRAAGPARGLAAAELRRHQDAMTKAAARAMGLAPPAKKRGPTKRRKTSS